MDMTKRLERLLERYRNGDLDRRSFLGLTAAAGLAAGVMTRWSGPALAAVKEVRFEGWGGVVSEALRKYAFDPYEKKTGLKVVDGTFGDENEIITQLKASQPGTYNVIHSSGIDYYARYVELEWTTVLDESRIPNLQFVMNALIEPFRKLTPDGLSCVPYDYGTTGIAYNTKYISKEEVEELGADLLIKPELKGKLGALGDMQTRVWYAALQTGQDPNDIKDMDAVWEKVRESRGLVKKYWGSGAELMDLLSREEIIATEAWSGRVARLQQDGFPIGFYDPPKSYAWMEDMLVLKGSPLPECEELLDFMLEPEVAIAVAEGQNYPPSLDPTKVELTEKIKNLPAFDPTGTLSHLTFGNPAFWTPNYDAWTRQWNRIEKGA